MRRSFKLFMMIFLCLLLSMGVLSCTRKPDTDPVDPLQGQGPAVPEKEPVITKVVPGKDNTEVVTLRYYTVRSDGQLERATSMVEGKTSITPEVVLDFLLDALEDESLVLNVDSVKISDSVCIISFDDSIYDIASEGERIENSVLDAIAQSILDNVADVTGVAYRIKGDRYETVNNSFTLDSVYME